MITESQIGMAVRKLRSLAEEGTGEWAEGVRVAANTLETISQTGAVLGLQDFCVVTWLELSEGGQVVLQNIARREWPVWAEGLAIMTMAPAQAAAAAPIDVIDPWRGLYLPEHLRADEDGGMSHPDLPSWPDDREEGLDKLVHAQGFDFKVVDGEFSDEAVEDGGDLYWQEMRAWAPEVPAGEWRLAWKGDTEDGPCAWFVRPMALRPEPEAITAPPAQADRMAIKMLVAAGFVSEEKANESLRIAHGFGGDLGQPATAPADGEIAAWRELADHVRSGAPVYPGRYTDDRTHDVASFIRAHQGTPAPAAVPVGLQDIIGSMLNYAGVADTCEVTQGHAPVAIRNWAEMLQQLAQSAAMPDAGSGGDARALQLIAKTKLAHERGDISLCITAEHALDAAQAALAARQPVGVERHTAESARALADRAVQSVGLIGTLAGLPSHVQGVVRSYAALVARSCLLYDGGQPAPAAVPVNAIEAARSAYKAVKVYSTGETSTGEVIRSVADMNRNDDAAWRAAINAALMATHGNINAMRYLYLRAQPVEGGPWGTPRIAIPSSERAGEFANGDDADSAIDAAIAAQQAKLEDDHG